MKRALLVSTTLLVACATESTSVPPVKPTESISVSPFELADGSVISTDAGAPTSLPDADGVATFDGGASASSP